MRCAGKNVTASKDTTKRRDAQDDFEKCGWLVVEREKGGRC
jgi:hypothetical protein